jgi:lipopolysaccharide export system protein LptC
MRRWSDRHTRTVTLLKLILPFVALGILSSLFIFSKQIDPEAAIPYATVDVDDRMREPKMTDAQYAGAAADGSAISISVAVAVPDATNSGGTAKRVTGRITTKTGDITQIDAAELAYRGNSAALTGGVAMASAGYVLNMAGMDVLLDRVLATSHGQVTGNGPLGNLVAGQMQLTEIDKDSGDYLLVFNSGVHLIYLPLK